MTIKTLLFALDVPRDTGKKLDLWGGYDRGRRMRKKLFSESVWGFPGGAVVKNPSANAEDTGSSSGPQQEKPPQWEARAPRRRVAPAHRN